MTQALNADIAAMIEQKASLELVLQANACEKFRKTMKEASEKDAAREGDVAEGRKHLGGDVSREAATRGKSARLRSAERARLRPAPSDSLHAFLDGHGDNRRGAR